MIIILIVMMMLMMSMMTIKVVIIVKEKKERRCLLIDITIPSEINTVPPQNLQRRYPGPKVSKLNSIGYRI